MYKNDTLAFLRGKASERNWDALGQIQVGQVRKAFEVISIRFRMPHDIKAATAARRATTFKALVEAVERAEETAV